VSFVNARDGIGALVDARDETSEAFNKKSMKVIAYTRFDGLLGDRDSAKD
jgi:hypothetical protein